MHFLIANGGQGGDDHVEAVEPRPAFDVVISGGANRHDQHEKRADFAKVAEGGHGGFQLSAYICGRKWGMIRGGREASRVGAGFECKCQVSTVII